MIPIARQAATSALPALLRQISRRNIDRNAYPADLLPAVQRRSQQDRPPGELGDQRTQREPHPAVGQADVHGLEELRPRSRLRSAKSGASDGERETNHSSSCRCSG